MSIRFAAPPARMRSRMAPLEARSACALPANDNGEDKVGSRGGDAMLHAALRHFADHGLAAALHARKLAEAARAAQDEQGYQYWRDVCRALDRRMARTLDQCAGTARP